MPAGDISSVFGINADGSVAPHKTPPFVGDAIFQGTKKPDYSGIRVPVLAFFAPPPPLEQQVKTVQPLNEEQRAILQSLYEEELAFSHTASSTLKKGVPDARIVEIQGAAHYMFLSKMSPTFCERSPYQPNSLRPTGSKRPVRVPTQAALSLLRDGATTFVRSSIRNAKPCVTKRRGT